MIPAPGLIRANHVPGLSRMIPAPGLIRANHVPGLGRVFPAPGLVSEVPVSGWRPALCRGPGRFAVPFTLLHVFHAYGSLASSSRILRGSPSQCLQHFMSTEYIRAMQ